MIKYYEVSVDWKACPDEVAHGFISVLKKVGHYVYLDPRLNGSDMFGWIITKEKISKKELVKLLED